MVRTGVLVVFVLLVAMGVQALGQSEFSSYDLDVVLDTKTRTLSGAQRLDYVNDTGEALQTVSFLLLANLGREPNPYIHPSLTDGAYPEGFDSSQIEVSAITDDAGQALNHRLEPIDPYLQTYSLNNVVLRVDLPQPLAPGARTTIQMEFALKIPHAATIDNAFYRDVYIWRFAWNPVAVPPSFFSEHLLSLPTAFYRATIKLPEDFVLATGADRQTLESNEDGWNTYLIENEAPTRSIALAASPRFEVVTLNHGVVPIEAYYLPGHESAMRLAASYAASQLDYYIERFGEYGYQRLVMVDNPGPGGYGMAADAMVLFGTDIFSTKDLLVPGLLDRALEWTVAHEVGHLWWGLGVGADFNAENWLSEGFAQYLSITYYEDKHGAFGPNVLDHLGEGLIENMVKDEFGYFNLRHHNVEIAYLDTFRNQFDEAIIKPAEDVEYGNATAFRTYMKGYLVNRALEGLIGREAMFETLKTIYERYNHQFASVEILQQVAEEVSGQDLEGFFQSWLYTADFADVAIKSFESGETDTEAYETNVELTRRGQAIYPVTVRVTTADGEQVEQTWLTNSDATTLTFNTQALVVSVTADPLEMLPDVNRFNNHSPRKVIFKQDEAGFPLDAYFIRWSGTGISGQQGLDHQWSINIVPSVEAPVAEEGDAEFHEDDEGPSEPGLEDMKLTLNGVAAFSAFVDRGLSVSGLLTVLGYDPLTEESDPVISGEVGVNWSLLENPPIGSPSTYWYPANFIRAGAGVLGTLADPVPYLGLDYVRQDALTLGWTNSVSARAGLYQDRAFVRGGLTSTKRLRLAHSTYIDVTAKLGGAPEPLPGPMAFSLNELQGFTETFNGDLKAFGRLSLSLPPIADINFSLANLAILENVTVSGFAQGGWVWDAGQPVVFENPKTELGVQLNVAVSVTLGVTLRFHLGYAYPLMGAQEGELGQVFFGI